MKKLTDEEIDVRNSIRPELQVLFMVSPGTYDLNPVWYKRWFTSEAGGFVVVDRQKDCMSIHWTSDRDTHNPRTGPSRYVSFSMEGTLEFYMESAITMWVKWHVTRGGIDDLLNAVGLVRWLHLKLVTENAQPS